MKMRITCASRAPYGSRYEVQEPEKGFVGWGNTFEQLISVVKQYRYANALPVGLGFEEELEALVCAKYPAECELKGSEVPRATRLSLEAVTRGTKVLAQVVAQWGLAKVGLAESPLVSEAEAAARKNVCDGCPWNVELRLPCGSACGELLSLVNLIRGNRAPAAGAPKACAVCSCVSDAHVHIRLDLLAAGVTGEMKAQFAALPHCWKQV